MRFRKVKSIIFLLIYKIYVFIYLAVNKFKKKELLVLYLYADEKKYSKSYDALKSILHNIYGFNITVVKIDNFNEGKAEQCIEKDIYDIPGDNRSWEYSGWGRGLRFVKEKLYKKSIDTVIFVNDAFLNDDSQDRLYFMMRYNTLTLYDIGNNVIGNVDVSKNKVELLGYNVDKWVRSNFLAVPYMFASKLNLPCISHENIEKVISEDFSEEIFKPNPPMNSNLSTFLRCWITEGWPQVKEFNENNWPIIRGKLIAILNERLLSVQFVQNKLSFVDSKNNYIFNLKSFFKLMFK